MPGKIDYNLIRSRKQQEYGSAYRDWMPIIVKQYKDRTHFLFELLQNAEDAGASLVRLLLSRNQFVVEHNGSPFTESDIISITKVAKSTKNDRSNGAIGKFGIGFKSVYAYTNTPRIYSGNHSFEIKDYIFPYEISQIDIDKSVTRIEIPFNNEEISAEKAFNEICRALREQIDFETLLFINNIKQLEISIEGHLQDIVITKEDRIQPGYGGNVVDINIQYSKRNKESLSQEEKEKNYILFTDCEVNAIKIAFLIEGKDILPVKNTRIYTFFPTDKESHQSFYIHAPFETTPARDNIVEDSDNNRKFISGICDGIEMAFCWMRDNGYLTLQCLNDVFPIFEYADNSIFYAIYEKAVSIIKNGERIIPTNLEGQYKSIDDVIFPENMTLVDLFSDDDIHGLFGNHRIFWIAREITRDMYYEFREFLKKNFKIQQFKWSNIILKLNVTFLENKEKKWYEKLFNSISTFCYAANNIAGSNIINISHIPFVRLTGKKNICAYENGKVQVYLNNPEICKYKIDSEFLNSSAIRSFYQNNLRIQDYDVCTIVTDTIFPKYTNRNSVTVSTDNLKENIIDLKAIKDAIIFSPSLKLEASKLYILTDGNDWYRPDEIYIPSGFDSASIPEYQLLDGISYIRKLSVGYQSDPKLDLKFFKSIGCSATLKRKSVNKNEYLDMVQKYIGKETSDNIRTRILNKEYQHGIQWDVSYIGFPKIFETIRDINKSRLLLKFLIKNINEIEIKGNISGANDQRFEGKSADSMVVFSYIGLCLAFLPWIYNNKGELVTVTQTERSELDPLYEREGRRILDLLPFKEENKELEKILSGFDDPEQKEAIREMLKNPEKAVEVLSAIKKKEIKEAKANEKKKKTPAELLAEMTQKSSSRKPAENPEETSGIGNPEKRAAKLEKEFKESMDYQVSIPKTSLKYTYIKSNSAEEKNFLQNEYNNGYCQICGTGIEKRDGSVYFEAINMLKTNELDDKYLNKLDTGWNSLCLCPNCAAKYQFGIKDMTDFVTQITDVSYDLSEDEFVEIKIVLQGKGETIKYSPRHFLALQKALEVFSE